MSFDFPFQYYCQWKNHCKLPGLVLMTQEQPGIMETTLEKTVILWGRDDVLTRAVETLLGTHHDWRVMRVSDDLDEMELAQVMEEAIPDVLIVHDGVLDGNVLPLIKFVQDFSELKIITIGLDNNKMDIYNKKTVCIKESSDLLAAIKNGATPET